MSWTERHHENFRAFTGPRRDFGLILLILNMILHMSFTGPTHLLSANVQRPVSSVVSGLTVSTFLLILEACNILKTKL